MRRAFTLVEMAIVLVIISIILSLGIYTFVGLTEGEKFRVTQQGLLAIKESLKGFVLANNRLPCPDINCDGAEDLCLDPAGCDFDGDGSPETPFGMCASQKVIDGTITINNPSCRTRDFISPAKVPPFLLPYQTVGTKDIDAFGRPWRYDVNEYLARGNLTREQLCSLLMLFSRNRSKSTDPYLPIVTSDKDTNDDNLIAVVSGSPTGYSLAGILISEGKCMGVSGKNTGANQEYELASKPKSAGNDCSGYDDLSAELTFEELFNSVCSGVSFKKTFYLHVENVSNFSVSFNVGGGYCFDPSTYYPAGTSMTLPVSIEDADVMKFYTNSGCTGTSFTVADIIVADVNGDGHVFLRNGASSPSDENVVDVFLAPGTSVMADTDNDGTVDSCLDANAVVNTVTVYLNSSAGDTNFYANLGCTGAVVKKLSQLVNDADIKHPDRRAVFNGTDVVELGENHPNSALRYKYLTVVLEGGTSFRTYPDFECVNTDDLNPGGGGIIKDFSLDHFTIFYTGNSCTGDPYDIHYLLYLDASADNDGYVRLTNTGAVGGDTPPGDGNP
jgi:prepilin-type N-terminal cleavage/methylation domain-containing protein